MPDIVYARFHIRKYLNDAVNKASNKESQKLLQGGDKILLVKNTLGFEILKT